MSNSTFTYNGHTYLYTDPLLTWQQAQAQAASIGGNLVIVNDAAEQLWLTNTFTSGGWIGFTDQVTEGVFQWISGDTVSFTNWDAGEPNNLGDENYAKMYANGLWNDDNGGNVSAGIIEVNYPPTLTTFSAPISIGNEDSEVVVSFADLQVKGDEADAEGIVDAFVVKAVSSGLLKIGLSPATATEWNASSNNLIDATHHGYWLPDTNANGTLNAFTVVAKDSWGLESNPPVQATIDIIAISDVNVTAGATPVEGGTAGTFLFTLDSLAPADGLTVNYTLAGTATLATDYTVTAGSHLIAVTANSFTIAAGESAAVLNINALSDTVLDPNETVILNLTTGTVYQLTSTTAATLTITDTPPSTPQNHAPTLITPAAIHYTDTPFVDHFTPVTGLLAASDSDNDTLTYGIAGGTFYGGTVQMSNAYGNLIMNTVTGAYGFFPNSPAIEASTVNIISNFTVTVSDGHLTDSKTLALNITQSGITESTGNDVLNGTAGHDVFNSLAGNDIINGLAGNDIIDGGAGVDQMIGGTGDDSYYVGTYLPTNEVITEYAHEGEDTVYTSVNYTLPANIENLVIVPFGYDVGIDKIATGVGNTLNNHLTSSMNDSLLKGLSGDDNYYVGNEGVTIVESPHNGWDTVLATANRTLEDNIEELYLLGMTDLIGNGNQHGNNLNGNAGNNILDGKGGADLMVGHAGNDTYYVDNTGDSVKESAGEGVDTVYSSISYRLPANVEDLVLTGSVAINSIGNELDNHLTGNSANNILQAGNGDDTLIDENGVDTLIGGLGKDNIILTDTTAATDTVRITKGDSLVSSHDVVSNFHLGTDNVYTLGVDRLDLDSATIAANVATFNGNNVGNINSHHISGGIINFDDVNPYSNPLAITNANLADVFSYLQTNITGHNTVAVVFEGNTFVFQDGGATDTLVELVGVTANSVNNTGLTTGSVWVV